MNEAIATAPPTYKLVHYGGEKVKGSFYNKELQRFDKKDEVYKDEKILRTRWKRGVKEYFINWKCYSEKFNSWIKEIEMTNTI